MPAKLPGERLQKVLAHAGVDSRRRCEELIAAGRVTVNDQVVTALGTRVDPKTDRVAIDGKPIELRERKLVYYALYKPEGYISTVRDPHGRKTARSLVPSEERLYPVGRLDYDSEGLLIFTNDGELSFRLMHPSFEHEKEYLVEVIGRLSATQVEQMREGMMLEGEPGPARAEVHLLPPGANWRGEKARPGAFWVRFILRQGRKRQIRRMLETFGREVGRLIRVRMGELELGNLKPGEGRWLSPQDAAALRRSAGLSAAARGAVRDGRPPAARQTERRRLPAKGPVRHDTRGTRGEQDHDHHRRSGSVRQEHHRRSGR